MRGADLGVSQFSVIGKIYVTFVTFDTNSFSYGSQPDTGMMLSDFRWDPVLITKGDSKLQLVVLSFVLFVL